MGLFIFSLIAIAIAVVGGAVTVLSRSEDSRLGGIAAIVFGLVVGGALLIGACVSSVPTKNVGIVTQFNRPTGRTTGAGLKWTAPWQDVKDWDASGQTYDHLGGKCLWVNIAAQRRACIPVQIEWAANPKNASERWAQYKETEQGKKEDPDNARFGTFMHRRVDPQMDAAVTSVFASFDPLGTVTTANPSGAAPDLNKTYRTPLLNAIVASLGNDIEIRSIAFGTPGYDEATNKQIAEYGQKVLEARNLAVDKANAQTRVDIASQQAKVDHTTYCLQIAEKNGKEPGYCITGSPTLTKSVG